MTNTPPNTRITIDREDAEYILYLVEAINQFIEEGYIIPNGNILYALYVLKKVCTI